MASRVVIGYDGSAASEDAVAFGLTWCRSAGDVPIVATVYPEEHSFAIGRVDVEWATYVGNRPKSSRTGPGPLSVTRRSTATSHRHQRRTA
jgi:hypothetical protein